MIRKLREMTLGLMAPETGAKRTENAQNAFRRSRAFCAFWLEACGAVFNEPMGAHRAGLGLGLGWCLVARGAISGFINNYYRIVIPNELEEIRPRWSSDKDKCYMKVCVTKIIPLLLQESQHNKHCINLKITFAPPSVF